MLPHRAAAMLAAPPLHAPLLAALGPLGWWHTPCPHTPLYIEYSGSGLADQQDAGMIQQCKSVSTIPSGAAATLTRLPLCSEATPGYKHLLPMAAVQGRALPSGRSTI